jgi:hypothetical protein
MNANFYALVESRYPSDLAACIQTHEASSTAGAT